MAGAGLTDAMNSWSLRFGHMRDFAMGRLVLPASMALLQVGFGLAHLGGDAMVQAHILSQADDRHGGDVPAREDGCLSSLALRQ
jgi:hypothetical protein